MMGGMMMDQQQMMSMRKQINRNHDLMEQIREEKSAEQRNKLMRQHMDSMQEQIQMMNKTMGDEDMAGLMPEQMAERMEVMNVRMNMMQMMMQQMMEHQDLVE